MVLYPASGIREAACHMILVPFKGLIGFPVSFTQSGSLIDEPGAALARVFRPAPSSRTAS